MVQITEHERLAHEILADLEAVDAKLRKLERSTFEPEDWIRAHVNVPERFMAATVALTEETPTLTAMNRLDTGEGRDTLRFLGTFTVVHDRITALGDRLKLNLKSRKARLAWQCLQIYEIAKALARDGRDREFTARVEMLGRDLGPRGRPRKARTAD